MSSGGPKNVTSTNVTQLPAWLDSANQFGATAAQGMYNNGQMSPNPYPGATVAPFSPMQEQYFTGVENLSQNGMPSTNAAQTYDANVLNGQYLSPSTNPYLQQTFNQAADAVQNQLGTEFEGSGRNPQASLGAQADQMNQLATDIYGNAYNTGINQMENALGNSASVASQGLMPLNLLGAAGSGLQQQAQDLMNSYQQIYGGTADQPLNALSNYMGLVNSLSSGATDTSTQPEYGPSTAQQAVGGAMTGASIGGMIAGIPTLGILSPVGAGIGAGIGALAGLL